MVRGLKCMVRGVEFLDVADIARGTADTLCVGSCTRARDLCVGCSASRGALRCRNRDETKKTESIILFSRSAFHTVRRSCTLTDMTPERQRCT